MAECTDMKDDMRIKIGTSGWHYDHWKGVFYPPDMPPEDYLAYYQDYFSSVEINNSFYQMPAEKTLQDWQRDVPEEFVFAVKASRYITHMKKLRHAAEPTDNFLRRADALASRRGPILFQLPPRWRCNPERLESFLGHLPDRYRYTFEFRDSSWFRDEIYQLLSRYNAAFCIYDLNGTCSPREVTADFVYVRLHGPEGPYEGVYSRQALTGWAGAFSTWARQEKEVYCYFDNDQAGYAVQNALELQAMIQKD